MKINNLILFILPFVLNSCGQEDPVAKYQLSISASPIEGGKVIATPQSQNYNEGQMVTLSAEPTENWTFKQWEGDESGSSTTLQITMNSNKSVIAVFVKKFYLNENGITCMCPDSKPGDKGTINGIEYESVDNDLLRTRRREGADMSKLCTSLVTSMEKLFVGNKEFNQNIENWDVSNVTDMRGMFSGSIFNKDIAKWNVRNVTNMSEMFLLSQFNQPLIDWNVGNVTDMSKMFLFSQFNQPIGNWDVSKVTDMSEMFAGNFLNNRNKFNQPIGNWNVSNVTNMKQMFGASSFSQSIENWDVSKVTDMSGMFYQSHFNQPIGSWNVGSVKNMEGMFISSKFNQPIGNWNVSNVTDMSDMFSVNSSNDRNIFNQPIGDWDVSKVTDMGSMFQNSLFNQNISKWCVTNIPTEPLGFSASSSLAIQNKPVWGTCPD